MITKPNIPADVIKRMQEISAELQNNAWPSEEARQFEEQLKREQKRQLELQQTALNELIAEKHKTLRQVDGKLRRETNRTQKRRKRNDTRGHQ